MIKTVSSGSLSGEKNSNDDLPKRSHSHGSLAGSKAVLFHSAELVGRTGTGPLENDLGASGSDKGGIGNGDQDEQSEDTPRRVTKKTSKKMIFVWSLMSYCIICSLFFIANAAILIGMWFRKMQYFIREPDVASLFDVIPNVFWILLRFLVGSLVHVLLSIFTILILIGIRRTENLVIRHKEKLMLWMFVIACIGEYVMFVGTIDHMGSSATVENGQAKDTLLPHDTKPEHQKCFDLGLVGYDKPASHVEVNLVRANLKWMVQVSCGTSNTMGRKSVPTWKLILERIFIINMQSDATCRKLKASYISDAGRDCSIVHFLDATIFAWLILDGLGIWFCVGIFYLYVKAVVRTKPGRFSFVESTYQNDIEALRSVAERVRKFAEHNNNNDKAVEEDETNPRHRRHSKKLTEGPIKEKAIKEHNTETSTQKETVSKEKKQGVKTAATAKTPNNKAR